MRKLRLDLDALAVDTFDVVPRAARTRGTVHGAVTQPGHPILPDDTIYDSPCQPGGGTFGELTCGTNCLLSQPPAGTCMMTCWESCPNTCERTCIYTCVQSCFATCDTCGQPVCVA